MRWTSSPFVSLSSTVRVATSLPLRSTVTRSARLKISSRRCDTYRMPAPVSRRSRTILKSRSTSPGGSTAVGSSSTSTPPPASQPCSAAAMATIVRSTGVALASGWVMSRSMANGARSRRACRACLRHWMRPRRVRAKPPCRARLSIVFSSRTRPRSWWTKLRRAVWPCRPCPSCADLHGLAVEDDLRARVGVVVARQHLDERRLARAVVRRRGRAPRRSGCRGRRRRAPSCQGTSSTGAGPRGSAGWRQALRLGAGRARLVAGPLRPHPARTPPATLRRAPERSCSVHVRGTRTDPPRALAIPPGLRRLRAAVRYTVLHKSAEAQPPCWDSCRDSS